MLLPLIAPFASVITLENEYQLLDVLRDAFQPLVVIVGVIPAGRGEQLDHRSQGAFVIENTAGVLPGAVPKPVREISCEDSLYLI